MKSESVEEYLSLRDPSGAVRWEDSAAVRAYFRDLEALLQELPPYVHDGVLDLVCKLIAEQERTAFLEGLRIAADLPRR